MDIWPPSSRCVDEDDASEPPQIHDFDFMLERTNKSWHGKQGDIKKRPPHRASSRTEVRDDFRHAPTGPLKAVQDEIHTSLLGIDLAIASVLHSLYQARRPAGRNQGAMMQLLSNCRLEIPSPLFPPDTRSHDLPPAERRELNGPCCSPPRPQISPQGEVPGTAQGHDCFVSEEGSHKAGATAWRGPNVLKRKKRVRFDAEAMARPEDGPGCSFYEASTSWAKFARMRRQQIILAMRTTSEHRGSLEESTIGIEALVESLGRHDWTVDVATTAVSLSIDETTSAEEGSELEGGSGHEGTNVLEASGVETHDPEDEPERRRDRLVPRKSGYPQHASRARYGGHTRTKRDRSYKQNESLRIDVMPSDPKPSCRCGSLSQHKSPREGHWSNAAALARLSSFDGKTREDDIREVDEAQFLRWSKTLRQIRTREAREEGQASHHQAPQLRRRRGIGRFFRGKF